MEEEFLDLLKQSLISGTQKEQEKRQQTDEEWGRIFQLAVSHAVIPLLYDAFVKSKDAPKALKKMTQQISRQVVQQNYHLLFLTKFLIEIFEKENIHAVVLKGAATASIYPIPELRKSGDVDLLILKQEQLEYAGTILEKNGIRMTKRQQHNHHWEYVTPDGITIELHGMLVEPFENQKMNTYLEEVKEACADEVLQKEVSGITIPILADGYHAYHLLIHMLQHFLLAGFGVRYLCDWVLFWNQDIKKEEKQKFLHLVKESGLFDFAQAITAVCIRYLGLDREKVTFLMKKKVPKTVTEELMKEILEAEEFGKSQAERMVAISGTGILNFAKEFQHQMHINYPKSGKIFLFWPVLWIFTMMRFIRNNRIIRKVSVISILKNAKKRSRLMQHLKLFSK